MEKIRVRKDDEHGIAISVMVDLNELPFGRTMIPIMARNQYN